MNIACESRISCPDNAGSKAGNGIVLGQIDLVDFENIFSVFGTSMIDLEKIIQACNMAIDDADDNFSNSIPFFQLADPRAVLELTRMVENSTGKQELERLIALIRNLAQCLKAVPDEIDPGSAGDRQTLISEANCVLAIYDN